MDPTGLWCGGDGTKVGGGARGGESGLAAEGGDGRTAVGGPDAESREHPEAMGAARAVVWNPAGRGSICAVSQGEETDAALEGGRRRGLGGGGRRGGVCEWSASLELASEIGVLTSCLSVVASPLPAAFPATPVRLYVPCENPLSLLDALLDHSRVLR